jgi:3-phenylpropionate/trans-cinnamate dioxygenase ferredoxin reductase component
MADRETVLIVGAGQAGAWVATTLRSEGFAGRVVLAGAEMHPPYERPILSKGLLNGESPARAFLRAASDYSALEIELRLGNHIADLDLEQGVARTRDNERLGFDKLVLATGSDARRLRVPGADLANVVYLRTMDDALGLRDLLAKRPRTVVIGGGFIGLETAAVARTLQCDVTILEALPHVLQRVAPPEIAVYFEEVHRSRGVDLQLGTTAQRMEGKGHVERVVCTDGRRLDCDLVIVAIGAEPATRLAAIAGLAVDNGVVVDMFGLTSHPAVFAAGDVTNHPNALLQRRLRLESWQNAQDQAIAVGKAVRGNPVPYTQLPWFWSDQFDLNLQMAGLPMAWDDVVVRGDMRAGAFSIFYVKGQQVVGVSTVNQPRDMSIARRLIEQRVAVDPIKLVDEQFPLKKLLRR